MIGYASGGLQPVGRRLRNSWVNHVLEVEHVYAGGRKVHGRTLCGIQASMFKSVHEPRPEPPASIECKTCQRVLDKRKAPTHG